ncbi:MAG: tetratricopeptide repeat protein, partial [Burkholderiales bacterium]
MKALPEAYNNLGNVLKDQGKISEATRCYQQALKLRPVYADAEYNLADALQTERRYEDAVTHYRRALKLSPDDIEALAGYLHTLQQICEWSEINMLSKRLLELIAKPDSRAVSPFSLLSLPSDLRLQQDNARKASRYVKRNIGAVAPSSRATVRSNRLRIGYLSADFHDHPTSYLIAELLELHDRSRFEIAGYSIGADDGKEMRRRIVAACDEFVDLKNLSSSQAAARIQSYGTHILVDLKGYTRFARTEILARRPAPVQVNYLGYPGTMGADFVDYIIADRIIVPIEHQVYFDEKCVYLPGTYQVNDRKRPLPVERPSRGSCGLPEH